MRKRLTAVAICAALTALSASPALAGEVTGSGKKENQNQGRSWCSFSGLNDDPTASTVPPIGDNGPGGQVAVVRPGEPARALQDPHVANPRDLLQPEQDPAAPAAKPTLTETVSTPGPAPA